MDLQLNFTNPLLVSGNFDEDSIEINVLEAGFFLAEGDYEPLASNYSLKGATLPA